MTASVLTLLPGVPSGEGLSYWRHEDPQGISEGAARALGRALSRDWKSGTRAARAAEFRDWLVFRSWIAGRLTGTAGATGENQILVASPDYEAAHGLAGNDRARAVLAIGRTPVVLAEMLPGGPGAFQAWTPPKMFTTGGETAAFPLVAVAIVTVVVAVAESAAVAYLAHQAAQVVDNLLARSSAARDMVEADAQVLRVLDEHSARETQGGKALPLDDAERRALDELEHRQKTLLDRKTPPIDEPVTGGGGFPWWSLPLAAAVGLALYLR